MPCTQAATAGPAILLIEDDLETAEQIRADFAERGYRVTHAATGPAGLAEIGRGPFDLAIIDRMLPELDGLAVVEAVRARGITIPVLFLSALGAVDDRVRGLEIGGDDYLTKPFALVELRARVAALLRRPAESPATLLRVGPLELDLLARRARRGDRAIELLPREFTLLAYLMRRADQVVTRDMMLKDVFNYHFPVATNLVDVHLGKLRRKIDPPDEPALIHLVRGVGFLIRPPQ